jgi:hypothetical protein
MILVPASKHGPGPLLFTYGAAEARWRVQLLREMEAPPFQSPGRPPLPLTRPASAASRGEESEGTSGAIQAGVIMRQRNPPRPAPQLCPLPASLRQGEVRAVRAGAAAWWNDSGNCCCVWCVGLAQV